MTKLYVLSYPPGGSGDFFAGRIIASNNTFYKHAEVSNHLAKLIPVNNRFLFPSSLTSMGLDDKRQYYLTITKQYKSIPAYSDLKDVDPEILNEIWEQVIVPNANNLNLLTSTHIKDPTVYPWHDKVVFNFLRPSPDLAEMLAFLFIVKNYLIPNNDAELEQLALASNMQKDMATKTSSPDSYWNLYYDKSQPITIAELRIASKSLEFYRDGNFSKMPGLFEQALQENNSLEHRVDSMVNMMINYYVRMRKNWARKLDTSRFNNVIELEKIYQYDKNELDKLFKSFDCESYDESIVWRYISKNIEMYNEANNNGDWKIDYANLLKQEFLKRG